MRELFYMKKSGEGISLTKELTKSLLMYSVYTDLTPGEIIRLLDYLQIAHDTVKEIFQEVESIKLPKALDKTLIKNFAKYIVLYFHLNGWNFEELLRICEHFQLPAELVMDTIIEIF